MNLAYSLTPVGALFERILDIEEVLYGEPSIITKQLMQRYASNQLHVDDEAIATIKVQEDKVIREFAACTILARKSCLQLQAEIKHTLATYQDKLPESYQTIQFVDIDTCVYIFDELKTLRTIRKDMMLFFMLSTMVQQTVLAKETDAASATIISELTARNND